MISQERETVSKVAIWIARALFVLAVIAFFLPIFSVSCAGEKVTELSSWDITVGKEVSVSNGRTERINGNIRFLLLLVFPTVAFVLTFFRKKLIYAIADIIDGIIVLVLSSNAIKTAEDSSQMYAMTIQKETGYGLFQAYGWIMLVLGAALIIICIMDKKDVVA